MPSRSLALLILALVGLIVVAPTSSEAAPREPQTLSYEAPWGMRYAHWWDEYLEMMPEPAPLLFSPRPGDRSVRLTLEGDDGNTVYAGVFQPGARGTAMGPHYFCGNHIALDLASDEPVEVKIYVGACRNHVIATGTSGTVTARFSTEVAPSTTGPHHHP